MISRWAVELLSETSHILLDGSADDNVKKSIRSMIEKDADNRITDLHVWRINNRDTEVVVNLVTHFHRTDDHYLKLLTDFPELKHITIEVNVCQEEPCLPVSIYPKCDQVT